MNDYTVVVNAGSSSLKFSVYRKEDSDSWTLDARGQVEGIGTDPTFSAKNGANERIGDTALDRGSDAKAAGPTTPFSSVGFTIGIGASTNSPRFGFSV